MSISRFALFALVLPVFLRSFAVTSASAQQTPSFPIAPWISSWSCGPMWPPVGFYIDSVSNEGRYLTLEDSTIWEVQPTDRSGAAGWKQDDFVQVHRAVAPNDGYEWLFTNVNQQDWRATVRLAGRVRSRQKRPEELRFTPQDSSRQVR